MTPEIESMLYEKRMKLQKLIDQFHRSSGLFLHGIDLQNGNPVGLQDDADDWQDVEEGDDPDDIPGSFPSGTLHPIIDSMSATLPAEKQRIRLPSSFGKEACSGPLKFLSPVELDLRKGQANDAMHGLRLAIGQKSFKYRSQIRQGSSNPHSGYAARTRSHAEIRTIQRTIDQYARIYTSSRNAMCALGASQDDLDVYRKLTPSDLVASTAVIDFNARGQRNEGLSWIWQRHAASTDNPEWMDECEYESFV